MNADVKQTSKVSAHVETSGWGKVVLNGVSSLPQMLNQWQRCITRSNKCLELKYVFVFIKQTQLYIKTSVLY